MFSAHRFSHSRFVAAAFAVAASVASLCHAQVPAPSCCQPWDNGGYDGHGAQTSQVGYNQSWSEFGRITFDDFWLCEGNIYKTQTVRGVLCTDSIIPKAIIAILRDCDGRPDLSPAGVVAIADSVPADLTDKPLGYECIVGDISLAETGQVTDEGFRIINVTASFPKLWLKGGTYWVTVIGYSGTADPDEQFFWGFANNGVVRGRPGVFYNSEDRIFTDVDQLCCDCTDFAFCVQADSCKILLDNGGPDITKRAPSFASPGSVFREARAADDIVVPPCHDQRLCLVEGYLLTNCDPPVARLEIYDNGCKLPATYSPPARFASRCVYDTGISIPGEGSRPYKLYKVQFWNLLGLDGSPFTLQQNKNYWFSIYGVGTGSQIQNAYAVGANRCDLQCNGRSGHFNEAAVSGLGIGLTDHSWRSISRFSGTAFDLALLVATDEVPQESAAPQPGQGPRVCAPDINHDGVVTVQDIFDYVETWFGGCP